MLYILCNMRLNGHSKEANGSRNGIHRQLRMWSRVVWMESDVEEEGVVPSNWVQGQTVRWPNTLNVLKPLAERKTPLDNWHCFDVVKVKFQSDDKKLCEDYDFTTTAEISEREDAFDEHIQQDCSTSCSPAVLPQPPRRHGKFSTSAARAQKRRSPRKSPHKPKLSRQSLRRRDRSNTRSRSRSPLFATSPRYGRSPLPSSQSKSPRSPSFVGFSSRGNLRSRTMHSPPLSPDSRLWLCQNMEASPTEMASRRMVEKQQLIMGNVSSAMSQDDEERPSSHKFPMPEGRFQKRVLHLLMEIRDNIKEVGKKLESNNTDFHISQASSLSDIKALEEMLADNENRKLLSCRLGKIGGSSIKDNVRNILTRIMTNEVMAGINMNGNGGKMAFRKTTLFEIITESVLKNHEGTEADVSNAISKFLKYAPDRKGGGGRKEKMA